MPLKLLFIIKLGLTQQLHHVTRTFELLTKFKRSVITPVANNPKLHACNYSDVYNITYAPV